MNILSTMRAMRSVLCWTLRQEIILLAVPLSTDLDHSPPKPPRTPFKLRRGSSTIIARPQNPRRRKALSLYSGEQLSPSAKQRTGRVTMPKLAEDAADVVAAVRSEVRA